MPEPPKASALKSWINGFDSEKAASGRNTPSIGSAYARLTAVPASPSIPPVYDLANASTIEGISSSPFPLMTASCSPSSNDQGSESPSHNQPRYRPPHLRCEPTPETPSFKPAPEAFLKPPGGHLSSIPYSAPAPSSASSKATFALTTPERKNPSPSSAKSSQLHLAPGLDTSIADPGPKTAGLVPMYTVPVSNVPASGALTQINWQAQPFPYPINTWDSASLTRNWTHDLVRTAILRIMNEINLDFYKDHYRCLDFDGSQQVVHKLWGAIKLIYTEFIKSYVYGIDILTLIGMHEQALNGGPLADVNAVLADMICFLAAGKMGMEKRAEDMAKALISGGDIINFVRRRFADNGLEYPGGIGRTEERLKQAYLQEVLLRGC